MPTTVPLWKSAIGSLGYRAVSRAILHTNAGPITVEFFDEDAPKTVENFRKLAGDGFYDGLSSTA